jgi:hypothetical protein
MSCRNHGYLVKHTLEECDLIKRYFNGDYKAFGMDTPSEAVGNKEKRDVYPDPKGCLMIFGGPVAYVSKHRQKLTTREVNAATLGEAIPAFLKWSKTAITFDKKDHPQPHSITWTLLTRRGPNHQQDPPFSCPHGWRERPQFPLH